MRTNPLAIAFAAALAFPAAADTVEPISRFAWDTDVIAGLSGLEVSADGTRFTAVGDRGFWISGVFRRDGTDITRIDVDRIAPIIGIDD